MELKEFELILLLGVRSKRIDCMLNILDKHLISRLKFIRQIAEFMPRFCSKEEEEIVDVLKQLTNYDISAKTVRKIEIKYCKKWF